MRNSPFAMFRRNQRQLMVVLTGLAMFAFIFLDPSMLQGDQLPRMLGVIFVALVCAGGLWIVGAPRGKGNEWAMYGALLGAVIAFFGLRAQTGAGVVVQTSIGSFTRNDFQEMFQRRAMANRFLMSAAPGSGASFGSLDDQSLLQRAILLHEAKNRGIAVSDDAVLDLIQKVTNDRLALGDYQKILRELGTSEGELFNIIREELAAQLAMQMDLPPAQQSGMSGLETPLTYWKQFERLQVRQALEVAPVPVEPFVATIPEPKDTELLAFFDRYKSQLPTLDGQPGFLQDRQVNLGYVVADYEAFEKQVAEPTEPEIADYYAANKERYRVLDLPDSPTTTPFDDEPASALEPANIPPESSQPETPGTSDPAVPPAPAKPEDGAAARFTTGVPIRLASFQAESGNQATDTASSVDEKPVDEKPAAESKSDATPKSDLQLLPPLPGLPAHPPVPATQLDDRKYRELDDDLKSEIRDQMLRERTFERMGQAVEKAVDEMARLSDKYLAEVDPEKQKALGEEITQSLKDYAAAHQLQYAETGLVTQQDLVSSTAEGIGAATEPTNNPFQTGTPVAEDAFDGDTLFDPRRADSPLRDKRYAYWKIADVPSRVPEFKDVREKVAAAWKLEQARPLAQKRAEELSQMLSKSDKPFAEALSGQTVTGETGGDVITARETPRFSWLNLPRNLPFQFNPMFSPPPQLSEVEGIEGAGPEFMQTVFEDLGPGDVGVAPNQTRSIFYVVKVKQRDAAPAEGEENLGLKALQQQFLMTGRTGFSQGAYMHLNHERLMRLLNEWRKTYEQEYEVAWNAAETEELPPQ